MHTPGTASLQGKRALVTGGARRIGAAIVRTLHEAGAHVVVHYHRSSAEADALCAELNATRAKSARAQAADLLDPAAVTQLAQAARAAFGGLDILVNNASSFYPTPLDEADERAWDDLMGTNLKAPFFLTQALAAELRAARGLVLNVADIHGMRPLRAYPIYSVAKAGLIMLTRSLARELAPEVRVNAVAPGPILWPEGADPALKHKVLDRTLLKRPGSPEDVTRAVLFFAAAAPYVTGQVLAVDGGRSVGW